MTEIQTEDSPILNSVMLLPQRQLTMHLLLIQELLPSLETQEALASSMKPEISLLTLLRYTLRLSIMLKY